MPETFYFQLLAELFCSVILSVNLFRGSIVLCGYKRLGNSWWLPNYFLKFWFPSQKLRFSLGSMQRRLSKPPKSGDKFLRFYNTDEFWRLAQQQLQELLKQASHIKRYKKLILRCKMKLFTCFCPGCQSLSILSFQSLNLQLLFKHEQTTNKL